MTLTRMWSTASEAVELLAELSFEIDKRQQDTRRAEPRYPVSVPIRAEPLSESLNTVGVCVDGITRDLSTSGIGIFHAEPFEATYVQITITSLDGQEVRALAQIRHTQKIGAFYHTGVEFLFDSD